MKQVSLAEAKAKFSELVRQVADGESIEVTLRGKPVIQMSAVRRPLTPIIASELKALTDTMKKQPESGGDFVRRMRDDDRY